MPLQTAPPGIVIPVFGCPSPAGCQGLGVTAGWEPSAVAHRGPRDPQEATQKGSFRRSCRRGGKSSDLASFPFGGSLSRLLWFGATPALLLSHPLILEAAKLCVVTSQACDSCTAGKGIALAVVAFARTYIPTSRIEGRQLHRSEINGRAICRRHASIHGLFEHYIKYAVKSFYAWS